MAHMQVLNKAKRINFDPLVRKGAMRGLPPLVIAECTYCAGF